MNKINTFVTIALILMFFIHAVETYAQSLTLECQIPKSWVLIDLDREKIDTDINPDIVIKAFKIHNNALILVTAYFLDDTFTLNDWLEAMKEAFSGDKNIKVINGEIEKIGRYDVVSLSVVGKGKLYRFDKNGIINIIRHTFLIKHGSAIIQFIIICQENQYSMLKSIVSNVIKTLCFKYKT